MFGRPKADPELSPPKVGEAAREAAPPIEPPGPSEPVALEDMRVIFDLAFQRGASDIHLTEQSPPVVRIDGELIPTTFLPLSREDTKRLIYTFLTDRQIAQFEREQELDLSVDVQDTGRFRVNVHQQRGSIEAAFRLVPSKIRTINELGLPPIVADLARKPNGLVLITGPTGMGKTTTLAAMVDLINHERRQVIVCIEDPIEYVHQNHLSVIKQREVFSDTKSFAEALKRSLRQDPDVIVVGEMRDLETIATALTAAETGHLVLATLHTPDAAQTIDRIVDVFPSHQQQQVTIQLADCFQAVVSQQLLRRSDTAGRTVAYEIMIGTAAVRNLIREHATEQVLTALQTGAAHGMITMDACLRQLYDQELISYETAVGRVKNLDEFELMGQGDPTAKKGRR